MSTLSDHEQNQRTETKKERAKKHFSRPNKAGFWKEVEQIENYEMGLVASVHKNRFDILIKDIQYPAMLGRDIEPGAAKDLVVGDHVFLERGDADSFFIVRREDRASWIARPRGDWTRPSVALEDHMLAANVDIGIITASVKDPDFHPRFIDRYLAILQLSNVMPLICLTKTELNSVRHPILSYYQESGILIVETSFVRSEGIEALKTALRGKTAVFLGQSGVGKSSLMSLLIPDQEIATGVVSEKTGKGKHTTTGSSLFKWDENSYIIDTPGIRSLGVGQIPKEEIRFLFPEFQSLSQDCRFSDCSHINEPGCAIKRALEEKIPALNQYRYESYLKMMME